MFLHSLPCVSFLLFISISSIPIENAAVHTSIRHKLNTHQAHTCFQKCRVNWNRVGLEIAQILFQERGWKQVRLNWNASARVE